MTGTGTASQHSLFINLRTTESKDSISTAHAWPPGLLRPCRQQISPQDSREVRTRRAGNKSIHGANLLGHQGERQGHLRLAPSPAAAEGPWAPCTRSTAPRALPPVPAHARPADTHARCPAESRRALPLAQAGWRARSPCPRRPRSTAQQDHTRGQGSFPREQPGPQRLGRGAGTPRSAGTFGHLDSSALGQSAGWDAA